MIRILATLAVLVAFAFPAASAPILSCTFTASTGASIARDAGPDLAVVTDGATWDQRAQDYLMWRAEQRLGSPPANIGEAVQSWVQDIYFELRASEKRFRTEAAVDAAEQGEDAVIPDE